MPASRSYREGMLLNLNLDRIPDDAPAVDLPTIVGLWQKIYKAGKAVENLETITKAPEADDDDADTKAGDSVLIIKQMEIDDASETITILFNLVDPDIADNTYTDLNTGDMRDSQRLENEAPTISAHLVIETKRRTRTFVQYRAVLEHVAGINRGRVQVFLNRLLRAAVKDDHKFEFTSTEEADGKKKKVTKKYRPKISFSLQASETVRGSIKRGELKFIDIISRRHEAVPLDDLPGVAQKELRVRLRTESRDPKIVEKIVAKFKAQDYEFDDVQLRIAGVARGSKPLRFSALQDQAQDLTFSRVVSLSGVNVDPLRQGYPKIHKPIKNSLAKILKTDSEWSTR
jgi:hypothetical protein